MPPKYVIVMQSEHSLATETDLTFNDDVHALVAARRLFVREVMQSSAGALSLKLGRQAANGDVDWLSGWTSNARPEAETARSARARPVRARRSKGRHAARAPSHPER